MQVIKGSTSKGQALLSRANYNEGYDLWDVYGTVSAAKRSAMDWCKQECYKTAGHGFRIISHNSFSFSVAWEHSNFEWVNPKTGEVTMEDVTRIETSSNTYVVLLNK